jgi:hypothetical protein
LHVETRLKKKAYYVKPLTQEESHIRAIPIDKHGGVFILWSQHGGPSEAWAKAKGVAEW